MIELSF